MQRQPGQQTATNPELWALSLGSLRAASDLSLLNTVFPQQYAIDSASQRHGDSQFRLSAFDRTGPTWMHPFLSSIGSSPFEQRQTAEQNQIESGPPADLFLHQNEYASILRRCLQSTPSDSQLQNPMATLEMSGNAASMAAHLLSLAINLTAPGTPSWQQSHAPLPSSVMAAPLAKQSVGTAASETQSTPLNTQSVPSTGSNFRNDPPGMPEETAGDCVKKDTCAKRTCIPREATRFPIADSDNEWYIIHGSEPKKKERRLLNSIFSKNYPGKAEIPFDSGFGDRDADDVQTGSPAEPDDEKNNVDRYAKDDDEESPTSPELVNKHTADVAERKKQRRPLRKQKSDAAGRARKREEHKALQQQVKLLQAENKKLRSELDKVNGNVEKETRSQT